MDPEPRELSNAEMEKVLDERTQRTLGMSLSEFRIALKEGELDPESSRVAGLAILVGERARSEPNTRPASVTSAYSSRRSPA